MGAILRAPKAHREWLNKIRVFDPKGETLPEASVAMSGTANAVAATACRADSSGRKVRHRGNRSAPFHWKGETLALTRDDDPRTSPGGRLR
jgi:hypothetical protein